MMLWSAQSGNFRRSAVCVMLCRGNIGQHTYPRATVLKLVLLSTPCRCTTQDCEAWRVFWHMDVGCFKQGQGPGRNADILSPIGDALHNTDRTQARANQVLVCKTTIAVLGRGDQRGIDRRIRAEEEGGGG